MKVSVEISMYALTQAYHAPIDAFVNRLANHPRVTVEYSKMSTYLFGEYLEIMDLLNTALETTLKEIPESVFIIKLSGGCH